MQSLEEQLASVIAEIRSDVPNADQFPSVHLSMALMRAMQNPASSVAKFQASLFEDESFSDLKDGWISGQQTGMAIQDHMLPLILIRAALKEGDVTQVLAEHRAFAEKRKSPLRNYFAVAGCSINASIDIDPTIRLITWHDMPASRVKKHFSRNTSGHMSLTDEIIPMRAVAGCAIEIDPKEGVELFGAGGGPPESSQADLLAWAAGENARQESARDIIRCAVLLTRSPIEIIGSWPEATDPAAKRHLPSAFRYSDALFDLRLLTTADVEIEAGTLRNRYKQLLAAPSGLRDVIRHAADRLNWAQRRKDTADRAIELGIALEMLLLHDIKEKTELSFRLAVHGATFIGGSKAARTKNFDLLRHAYTLRSAAVHNGRLPSKHVEQAPAVIDTAIDLTASIALKLLDRGKFPNWTQDCVLGGE